MPKPHDPDKTVDAASTPDDSLDAGLAAGFGRPADGPGSVLSHLRSTLGPLRPVLLKEAEGESALIVRPTSDALPTKAEAGERYQISGEIARGGMGAVLRGRDVDLGRDLAVKVLLEKYADRPEVARRFIEEAQIGGQLQHPGVVPVYDIGRFGDRPYFTMKLVKGQTLAALLSERIDPAADRPQLLGIALQVAQAMAYAHAKGVIHRDLKPANIMVGAFGEVQVMDWGLAKVLAEGGVADEERASRAHHAPADVTTIRTARSTGSAGSFGTDTEAGSILGTPAYMPPEQALGDIALLDRRADVFALGALLCEILTGKPPYLGRSSEEVRRKAANGDLADAMSRLDASGAEVELIALTKQCLSPEAIDRPKDAQAVADGLSAYQTGVQERLQNAERERAVAEARAVEERRKRKWQLGLAASVVGFTLLGAAGLATFATILQSKNQALATANTALTKANVALDQQRTRAEQHEQQAIDAVKRFRDAVADNPELKNNPGLKDLRRALLKEPLTFFQTLRERLQAEHDTRPEALRRLAKAMFDVAFLTQEIGDRRDAARLYREVLPILERLAHEHPQLPALQAELAVTHNNLGYLLTEFEDPAGARAELEAAKAIQMRLMREVPSDVSYVFDVTFTLNNLGNLLLNTGDLAGARVEYEAARAVQERLAREHPDSPGYGVFVAACYHNLGILLHKTRDLAGSRAKYEAARAILEPLTRDHPSDVGYAHELGLVLGSLGELLRETGDRRGARATWQAAQAIQERLTGENPSATQYARELATTRQNQGSLLLAANDAKGAQREFEAVLEICQKLADAEPESPDCASQLGASLSNLALVDLREGLWFAAQSKLEQAITWQRKALAANPSHSQYRQFLENHLQLLAQACTELNDADGAADARRGLAELVASDPRFAALDARLDGVLQSEPARDNPERLALAQRAYDTKRYALAARLWGEAIEADPKLADDREAQHRYNAACAAALAADGKGEGDPKPDDAARVALRRQALEWLKAEVAAWSAVLDSEDQRARQSVARILRHWQQDTDLAGIRDVAQLAKLPAAERLAFNQLWSDVDAVCARARGAGAALPSDTFAR